VANGLLAIPLSSKPTHFKVCSRGCANKSLAKAELVLLLYASEGSVDSRALFLFIPMQRPLHVGSRSFFNITISDYV
jgi:hypothetical protein